MLHSPSLASIVTVVRLLLPTVTSLGIEDELTMRSNVSLPSNTLSSFINTLNEVRVIPGLNWAKFGSEL